MFAVIVHTDSAGTEWFLLDKRVDGRTPGGWRLPAAATGHGHGALAELTRRWRAEGPLELTGVYRYAAPGSPERVLTADAPCRFVPASEGDDVDVRWVARAELATLAARADLHGGLADRLGDVLALHDAADCCRRVPAAYRRLGGDYLRDAAWVRDQLRRRPLWQNIPVSALVALRGYTTGRYHADLNDSLRTGDPARLERYRVIVAAMRGALDALPAHDGPVRRVAALTDDDWDAVPARYRPGAVVREPVFLSAQRDGEAGTTFVGNLVLEIDARTGRDIDSLSVHDEREVLFAPGTAFVV
ncbi:MAG: hypothetical protein HOV66_19095, partial [Streptomycetaceae bacterium]|nr:hypothetical protein [Streptomycetaceae bacterium]